jgi:hypothetical protein
MSIAVDKNVDGEKKHFPMTKLARPTRGKQKVPLRARKSDGLKKWCGAVNCAAPRDS